MFLVRRAARASLSRHMRPLSLAASLVDSDCLNRFNADENTHLELHLDNLANLFEGLAKQIHQPQTLRHQTATVALRQMFSAQSRTLENTPYTLEAALEQEGSQPRLIFKADAPFPAVWSNKHFNLNHDLLLEVQGLSFLQGPRTNVNILDTLHQAMARGVRASGSTIIYPSPTTPRMAHLQVSPLLSANGSLDHCLLVAETLPSVPL